MTYASIKITDSGWSLPDDLLALDDLELQAGILAGTDAHEGISTASLALLHEDGAPRANVPARPFIRPTWDGKVGEYEDAMESAVVAAVKGNADPALVKLADKVAEDIRETITSGQTGGPALEPETTAGQRGKLRKHGNTPLIDTGALLESINGQVVKGSQPGGDGDG
jgi:hypothetical protein